MIRALLDQVRTAFNKILMNCIVLLSRRIDSYCVRGKLGMCSAPQIISRFEFTLPPFSSVALFETIQIFCVFKANYNSNSDLNVSSVAWKLNNECRHLCLVLLMKVENHAIKSILICQGGRPTRYRLLQYILLF